MNPKIMVNINLDIFVHSDNCRLKNGNFKNIKIVENCKNFFALMHLSSQGMFQIAISVKNSWNFFSGFFPDFPDPVFSRKKIVCGLVQSQTLCQSFAHFYYINYISSLVLWRNVENMKNAKNILFWGLQSFLRKNL